MKYIFLHFMRQSLIFGHTKKYKFRACIESFRAYEKFKISERKVNFFKRLDL